MGQGKNIELVRELDMKKFFRRFKPRAITLALTTLGLLATNIGVAMAWNPPGLPPL